MKTTAGRRIWRVKVQRPVETRDSYGQPIPAWKTVVTRYAGIFPLRGREGEQARQVVATATHKIEMHYVAGLVPKWRLLFGTRVFNIDYVANPGEQNEELELIVTEVV